MQKMQLFLLFAAIVGGWAKENVAQTTDAAAPLEASGAVRIDALVDGFEFDATPAGASISVTPCSLSAPNRNDCIKGLFNQILPNLKDGLPAYNMSSIEPYFYRRGIFRYSSEGIEGGMIIKNMLIHGISNMKVNNVMSNFTEDNRFVVKLGIGMAELKAGGNFKADVKFGGLRFVPKGLFNVTVENIRSNILTDGRILKAGASGRRVQLSHLNANIAIGDANVVANGIFSDKGLNTMILNLINQNLPEITRIGIPATRDQWAPVLVEHINGFFAKIPIEKFLAE